MVSCGRVVKGVQDVWRVFANASAIQSTEQQHHVHVQQPRVK